MKNTQTFIKFVNGKFGLREWCPDLKTVKPQKPKDSSNDGILDDVDESELSNEDINEDLQNKMGE